MRKQILNTSTLRRRIVLLTSLSPLSFHQAFLCHGMLCLSASTKTKWTVHTTAHTKGRKSSNKRRDLHSMLVPVPVDNPGLLKHPVWIWDDWTMCTCSASTCVYCHISVSAMACWSFKAVLALSNAEQSHLPLSSTIQIWQHENRRPTDRT